MTKRPTVVPLLMLLLGACASTPDVRTYTLDLRPAGAAQVDRRVRVERFVPTEALDRSEILVEASPTRVEHYATDRWVSSVGDQVRAKLAAELGATAAGGAELVIGGRVLAFGQVDGESGPSARVSLAIVVRDAGAGRAEAPLLERTYDVTRPAEGGLPEAVVVGLSRAMEAIAAELAADLAAL
ncbi:MAG: ABC-type transport auxiliary lipoprotein family protein [Thermoanaerobaculales bacterium]|jgi:ABC-type uncharacterized transport system auxiliary subunit|nr:ABC-type transport auxiliary lipoprotein family protein [Thermoanaerobaculales bacterium]